MSLRIAVLGTTGEPGHSCSRDSIAGMMGRFPIGEKGKLDGMGCQWVPVPEPLSLDGIASLRRSHACLVLIPEDVARKKETHAGLAEDFKALRSSRGADTLPGQMPVLLLLPNSGDSQSHEMLRLVQELNREFGRDFGGFHFSSAACDSSSGDGRAGVQNWLRFARDYRKRSSFSSIRAWFTVFFLAFLLAIFVCVGFVLACDKQIRDQATIRRLEFGLLPPKETLFLVHSLEPMLDRLEEMRDFLDSHPDLRMDRRARLIACRDRLDSFVNAILESSDWPELANIPDMPSLREVARSVESWSPPKIGKMSIPLVEKSEAKRRTLIDAWERGQNALTLLEDRLALAARLLNQEIRASQAWRTWEGKCADFCQLDLPIDWEDPIWYLEEIIQSRQSLQAQIATIAGAVQLASGLGLMDQSENSVGPFFPTGNGGESLGKVSGICELVFKAAGKDAGVYFSKLGPALGDSLKVRSAECRKRWLAIGRNELEADLGKGVISRAALQAWVGKSRKNPVMERYGNWLQWLGEFDFRLPGNSQKKPILNPILQVERFVALDSAPLRPNRCRLTITREESGVEGDLVLELTVRGVGSEKGLSSHGIKVGPGQWDFHFLYENLDNSGIAWAWNDSLRLVVKGKKNGQKIIEIIAENPAYFWKMTGDLSYGLDWDFGSAGFFLPELLGR